MGIRVCTPWTFQPSPKAANVAQRLQPSPKATKVTTFTEGYKGYNLRQRLWRLQRLQPSPKAMKVTKVTTFAEGYKGYKGYNLRQRLRRLWRLQPSLKATNVPRRLQPSPNISTFKIHTYLLKYLYNTHIQHNTIEYRTKGVLNDRRFIWDIFLIW